jgi:hypothetical protein
MELETERRDQRGDRPGVEEKLNPLIRRAATCGECQQLGAAPDLDDLIVTVSEPTSSGALRVRGVTDSGNLTDVYGAVLNNDVRGVRRFVDANHPDGAVWMVRA